MQLETLLSKTYLFADGQKGAKLEFTLLHISEHFELNYPIESGQRKSERKLYSFALFLTSPEFVTN
jgi:hypothetical protein